MKHELGGGNSGSKNTGNGTAARHGVIWIQVAQVAVRWMFYEDDEELLRL